ncbi:aminotransferase class V-fold PLP-dependent enzyme [Microlunatus flavus]|uniref:Selenocysteine lyase/Cysteine desulfurase n=1 Tax=Microlunatus flavus TaxID=1036181 RepID=A0A1H9L739_9ACTN|nr:aminotransferase class V-fold PLP-dependent enzyme [Microlunatus flavus]SER07246.1 Selenocysteine lyase/Cysteine desulfurase [Microlunatus flavus]
MTTAPPAAPTATLGGWIRRPGYLDTAAYGLPHPAAHAAMSLWLSEWADGAVPYSHWLEGVDAARALFAGLIGMPESSVATGVSTSQLAGQLAQSLRDGARVLAPLGEFASLVYPFLAQRDRGVIVDEVPLSELAHRIDHRSDIVLVSPVSAATGDVAPLDEIAAAVRGSDTRVIVDGAQACGWLNVDWSAFDAVIVPAFKWLCAPRGIAFLSLSRRQLADQRPSSAGWFSHRDGSRPGLHAADQPDARALDISPVWSSWTAAAASLRVLADVGIDAVNQHSVSLANHFRAGLGRPPADTPIVVVPDAPRPVVLREAGLTVTSRANHVRIAFHLGNTKDDADLALEALAR